MCVDAHMVQNLALRCVVFLGNRISHCVGAQKQRVPVMGTKKEVSSKVKVRGPKGQNKTYVIMLHTWNSKL